MKCFVYRNLHKKGYTYSIKALDGEYKGKVIGYASMMTLLNVELRVNQKGRERVLQENKKNVHAGVVGTLLSAYDFESRWPVEVNRDLNYTSCGGVQIKYNPYINSSFIEAVSRAAVRSADRVEFSGSLIEAYGLTSLGPQQEALVQHP